MHDQLGSALLRWLADPGSARWRAAAAALAELAGATDWGEAAKTGRVIPARGVDPAYDAAQRDLRAAQADLEAYLKQVRQSSTMGFL